MPRAAGGLPCINICSACLVLHPSVNASNEFHATLASVFTYFFWPASISHQDCRLKDTSLEWSKLWTDVMLTIPEGALLALLILGDNWMTSLGKKKREVLDDSVYPCQNCPLSKLASSTASQSQSELSSKASQPISNFQLTTLSSTLAGHRSKNSWPKQWPFEQMFAWPSNYVLPLLYVR